MFEPDSRYYDIDEATIEWPDGRQVAYKRRRIIGRQRGTLYQGTVTVADNERLDHIAARTVGDPRHYWRLCDANGVMNPREIDQGSGRQLTIPVPGTEAL